MMQRSVASTMRTVMGAAALAASAGLAGAGGSAENAVLVINPASLESMYIGAYYKNARNIPDSNVFYVEPAVANYATFAAANGVLDGFFGMMANARIDDHTDFVVVTPGNSFFVSAPNYVTLNCSAVNRFSIGSVFTMAHLRNDILVNPKESPTKSNGYYVTGNLTTAFDSNTAWLGGVASTDPAARRYYIGSMLGFSGAGGNTLGEITAMIDRSVAADGTRPAGTFYFMNTTDAIRNVRQPQFAAAISALTGLGGTGMQVNGNLPIGFNNCLGIMSGYALDANTETGAFTVLPGAFCDHLTSWAAAFDAGAQTRVSSWIKKGASASYGEVEEPCNFTGKFPNARIHSRYFAGMSLGEACFRSLEYVPYQGLFYGDPLTRAFTHIPSVSVSGVPGGVASGFVTLTPSATTTHPSATIASYDLLVDGVLRGSTGAGGSIILDTTLLNDGWHDLRVLAYDDTATRSSGRFVSSINTGNSGYGATLSIPAVASANLSKTYQFDVSATGGTPVETRILVNNRVVSAGPGAGTGVASVRGWMLGPGNHFAQAEVTFADGRTARSPRVPLTIAYFADAASGAAPVAFSYTRHVQNTGPAIIELPASFDSDSGGATYSVVTNPAGASIGTTTTRGYRVITPTGSPCGTDTLAFTVTTTAGVSNVGTVTLVYDPPYRPCPSDFDGNGFINGDDFDAYTTEFILGTPAADFNNDCFTTGADFDAFIERFELGC